MCRLNLVKGLGPALQIAEGSPVDLPEDVHDTLDERTNPDLADDLVRAEPDRRRAVPRCLYA